MTIEGYERRLREQWEQTRYIMYTTHLASMSDAKHKAKRKEKFFPLPWDKVNKPQIVQDSGSLRERYEQAKKDQHGG